MAFVSLHEAVCVCLETWTPEDVTKLLQMHKFLEVLEVRFDVA